MKTKGSSFILSCILVSILVLNINAWAGNNKIIGNFPSNTISSRFCSNNYVYESRRCQSKFSVSHVGVRSLRCKLEPLTKEQTSTLLPLAVSRDQWSSYWGKGLQQAEKVYEAAVIAFVGVWACYFTSFFLGSAITSILGTASVFYWLLGPNIVNFQKNSEFRGKLAPNAKSPGTRAALFTAPVVSIYEEENPMNGRVSYLHIEVEDDEGRSLSLRVPPVQGSHGIHANMKLQVLLISDNPDGKFNDIIGVSDAYVASAGIWIGEYPYVSKAAFKRYLADRKYARRHIRNRREKQSGTYEKMDRDGKSENAFKDTEKKNGHTMEQKKSTSSDNIPVYNYNEERV